MSDKVRQVGYRVGGIVFVIAALSYASFRFWKTTGTPMGSERDEVLLACLKCNQDSVVSSAEFDKLAIDPNTGDHQCPKCGALAGKIAPTRCEKCGRGIPPQPLGSALVCPFCKASLDVMESPPPEPPAKQP